MLVDLPTGKGLAVRGWKRRFVTDFCDARGLRCIALRPWVSEQVRRGVPFRTGLRHWDAAGHALVAEGLRQGLIANGILACDGGAEVQACAHGP